MPREKRRKRDGNESDDNSDSSSLCEGTLDDFYAEIRSRMFVDMANIASEDSRRKTAPKITNLNPVCQDLSVRTPSNIGEPRPSTSASVTAILQAMQGIDTEIAHMSTQDVRVPSSSNETSSRSQDRSAIEPRNNPVTPPTANSRSLLPKLSSAVSVLTRSRDRLTRGRPSEASTSQSVDRYRRCGYTDRRHDRRHDRGRRQDSSREYRQRTSLGSRSARTSHRDCIVNPFSSAPAACSSASVRVFLSPEIPSLIENQNQDSSLPTEVNVSFDANATLQLDGEVNAEASATEFALIDDDNAADDISDDDPQNDVSQETEVTEDLNKKILTTVECPVCFDLMSPPMSQCRRGHLVCSVCRQRLNLCPTCRAPFTNRRNFYVERIAEMLKYPCRHAGCDVRVDLHSRVGHEANCRLRPRHCALSRNQNNGPTCIPTCSIPRSVPMLLRHYREHHAGCIREGSVHRMKVWLLQHNWIIIAHRRMFHLNVTTNSQLTFSSQLTASVQYYGQEQNCRDFLYTIELNSPGSLSRGYHYTRRVHSDLTTVAEIQRSFDTFCLANNAVKCFEQSNNELELQVEILDVRQARDRTRKSEATAATENAEKNVQVNSAGDAEAT